MSPRSLHVARQRRPSRLRLRSALRENGAWPTWRDTILVALVVALGASAAAERALSRTASPDGTAAALVRDGRAAPRMLVAGAAAQRRDGEYLPLVTVSAVYPAAAQAQGIEGRCVVEYTIAATGATRDVRARDCAPAGVFERAAVAAARQFKYRPRIRDGAPVAVAGVRNEFRFALDR
jgi:TonB family protein